MASGSGYALPTANGGSHNHAQHGHARSYSGSPYLSPSPNKASFSSNGLPASNGYPTVKKSLSHSGLWTHAESSRETSRDNSPLASPGEELYKTPFEYNTHTFQSNGRLDAPTHSHSYTHSRTPSWSPMKGHRPRGESDLGRPADPRSHVYKPRLETIPAAPTSWFSLPEALTAMLVPLPYLLASAAYSSITHEELSGGTHELPAYARLQRGGGGQGRVLPKQKFSSDSGLIEACTLTSGTLLLVGILAKMRAAERVLDRRKEPGSYGQQGQALLKASAWSSMGLRALSLGLPFYSAMQIGGLRTGLVLLATMSSNLSNADEARNRSLHDWQHILASRKATLVVLAVSLATDFAGWTFHAPFTHMVLGYLALAFSALVLPPPLPSMAATTRSTADPKASPITTTATSLSASAASHLTCSTADVNITLLSGLLLSIITIILSMVWATAPSIRGIALTFSTLAIAAMSASILFSQPDLLRSKQTPAGLGAGYFLTACCAFMYSPHIWPGTVVNGGLCALGWLGVLYDTSDDDDSALDVHEHTHSHTHHHHGHQHAENTYSGLTKFMLSKCRPGSLIYGILAEKDSRRIAYFTLLNFGFMIVQGIYGYLSGSLGLLSDTVHMFFDCLGLVIGLGAAVASKWPTSPEKPYGWGKLNTLSGFGNGVFLMLVSVEFVWEAIEGILEHKELRHVQELMVVSVAGLLVNLTGLLAFGHAHAGHDHGHSHGHSHDHDHASANGHAHSHACSHDHDHGHSHGKTAHNHTHAGHAHDHHNENMHGIFLHVAADAGGSLAVILSTALTLWKPWYLWDPLATIIIAVLIFAAAVPLVTSSGQKLLLVVSEDMEYGIKNTLQELGEMRGVVGYAMPRFWLDDRDEASGDVDGHHHHHLAAGQQSVMGVIHVIAAHSADLEDVRVRVDDFVKERGMDLVIHVEREADGTCWCGGTPALKMG